MTVKSTSAIKLSMAATLLLGGWTAGCGGADVPQLQQAPGAEAADDTTESERSWIEAAVTLRTLSGEVTGGASYRMAGAGVPTSGDFELLFSRLDAPDQIIHTEVVENAPFGSAQLRVPADVQGEFFISAWIYGDDGSVFATADLIRGADGERLYPEAQRPRLDLRFGQTTDLTFVFFEQLDFGGGSIDINPQLDVSLQLTDEQRAMVAELAEPRASGRLESCLAYGMSLSRELSWDEGSGRFSWPDDGDAIMLVGRGCELEVKITDDGAPRFVGETTFDAPPGNTQHLEVVTDLRVIDSYVDVSFNIMGTFADVGLRLGEDLTAFLDESEWDAPLRYVLSADNGIGTPTQTVLGRNGDALSGVLTPIDQYNPHYNVTLTILAGDTPVLSGWSAVEMYGGSVINFVMSYDVDVVLVARNWTNLQANAWLSDDADVTSGIEITMSFTTPEGWYYSESCVTGEGAPYSCTRPIPTYSTGEVTFRYEGYQPVTRRVDVSQVETLNLSYVSLVPEGEETPSPSPEPTSEQSPTPSEDESPTQSSGTSSGGGGGSAGVQPSGG